MSTEEDPFMEWAKFTGLTNPAYEERLPIAREAWLAGRVELQAEIKRLRDFIKVLAANAYYDVEAVAEDARLVLGGKTP